MPAELMRFAYRDPLLTPREVVDYVDGKIGYDRARAICRTYGVRPGTGPNAHLLIRRSVLEQYLTNPRELTKNDEKPKPKPKPKPARRGRSWI